MYSLLVLASLTTTATTPSFFFGGCGGCGGGFLGGFIFGGGCSGSSCRGAGYGCQGYGQNYGCQGYYRAPAAGCYGCHGVTHHAGCNGCYGTSAYGTPPPAYNYTPAPPSTTVNKRAIQIEEKREEPKPSASLEWTPSRARVIVEVPEDAKVFIDDRPMKAASGSTRQFITPDLEANQDYYYMLRAETVRNGKTVAETQRVVIRAGQEFRASFANPAADRQVTTVSLVLKE